MNRDFIRFPVQTHLELLMQMADSGLYTEEELELCNKAYYISLDCVYNMFRGSGKPFISHLLGTSSILVALGLPAKMVIAGLMHALYQRRVKFPFAESLEDRSAKITKVFGFEIASLVEDYTHFEAIPLNEISALKNQDQSFHDVLMLRLADELEDVSYYALFMHGNPEDTEETKGGYLWRRKNKKANVAQLFAHLEIDHKWQLLEAFDFWIDAEPSRLWTDHLKSGKYSSFSNLFDNDI